MKDKIQSSQRLGGFLSRLLVLRETYPQLKASESFLKLQDSLEGTENRISVERKRYNDDVRILNTYQLERLWRVLCFAGRRKRSNLLRDTAGGKGSTEGEV